MSRQGLYFDRRNRNTNPTLSRKITDGVGWSIFKKTTEYDRAEYSCGRLSGGASRARTDDLIVANDALSQLSYSPARAETAMVTQQF